MISNHLNLFGFISILLGMIMVFVGIQEPYFLFFVIPLVLSGLLLIGFSELIKSVKNIENKLVNGTIKGIDEIIRNSKKYFFKSDSLDIYTTHDNDTYPLVVVQGKYYIRLKLLKNYVKEAENHYHFFFPNKESIMLTGSDRFEKDIDLFGHNGLLYVKLCAINLKLKIDGNELWIND